MKLIKQEIKEKSRSLPFKWTVTLEHGQNDYDSELEKEITKTLQEEIDWEVMIDILTEIGWTKIEMDWSARIPESTAQEVKEWCRQNLKGNYKGRGRQWLFEKEKDATMFVLRWS